MDEYHDLKNPKVQVFNISEWNATQFEHSHIPNFWPKTSQSIFGNMNRCRATGDNSECSFLCKKSYPTVEEKHQSPGVSPDIPSYLFLFISHFATQRFMFWQQP